MNLRQLLIAPTAAATLLAAGTISPAGADAGDVDTVPAAGIIGDGADFGPGVQMVTDGAQCTANFTFADADGALYLGYAAHCAADGAATNSDGCDPANRPLADGTRVDVAGEDVGTLVYSSWAAMQANGETDVDACRYNDFALVRLDDDAASRTYSSVPVWGGPTGLDEDGSRTGDTVYSYGNSGLRPVDSPLSAKIGTTIQDTGDGWAHVVYHATPGIPGDSGSGQMDAEGRANGVASTLALAPLAGSNNFIDLNLALDYAQANGFEDLRLVLGTEDFSGGPLGLLGF